MPRRLFKFVPLFAVSIFGCARPQPPVIPPSSPVVVVAKPSVRNVVDYQDFTGRAKASEVIDLKARVSGYLNANLFKDGERVEKGQKLFEIDPGLYATELARTKAAVKQAEATVGRITKDVNRIKNLGAASQSEKDLAEGQLEEAKAALDVARKIEANAQKTLDYCAISAPTSARIGRRMVDKGGLVKADETLLATLVVTDPIYVFFDVDDRTDLQIKQLISEKKLDLTANGGTQVRLGLPNEDGFSRTGTIKFIDTQLTASTGTITIRADVDNSKNLITPGLFVRVRLPLGDGKKSILVPEEAIGTDQGLKFVYVLNENDEVEYRQVKLGLQDGPDRVVEPVADKPNSGVQETDRVVTEGVQRIRKGVKVTVKGAKADEGKK